MQVLSLFLSGAIQVVNKTINVPGNLVMLNNCQNIQVSSKLEDLCPVLHGFLLSKCGNEPNLCAVF